MFWIVHRTRVVAGDRLELALFTIHHRLLAEAAARAGDLLHAKTA